MGLDIMIGIFRFDDTEDLFGFFGTHQSIVEYLGDTKIGLGNQCIFRIGSYDQVINRNSCFRFAGFVEPTCQLE